jgi:hypothetical protein
VRGCYLAARARRIVATASVTRASGRSSGMPLEVRMIEVSLMVMLRVEIGQ